MAQHYSAGDEPVPGSGYRLVEFLGRGGFGEVWKASSPGGAEAALKIIHLGGREGRKEFRALQLVKRIRHPNLVPIFAFWLKGAEGEILDDTLTVQGNLPQDDTQALQVRATMSVADTVARPQAAELIIAMGLGDESLFDRLKKCREQGLEGLPQDELLHYMEGAAEAIDFLNRPVHNLGSGPVAIQHCDIKPHNLMIVGGAAQVCDFGLARSLAADRTNTGAATIAYAAPECLTEGKPSASTDQYSLAITYFELKTGRLPYHDENFRAVLDAKCEGNLDFSPLPEAEVAVLRRATSQNPTDRFESSAELVAELRYAVEGSGGSAEPPAAKSHGLLITLLLLIPLLAAGGIYYSGVWPKRKAEVEKVDEAPPQDPAQAAFLRAEKHLAQGESGLAIDDYTQAIQLKPAFTAAILGRARAYLKVGQYDSAITDFQALDPAQFNVRGDLAEAYFQRGNVYFQKQEFSQALAEYELVLQQEPKYGKAYLGRGRCYLKQKQYAAAIKELQQAKQWLGSAADSLAGEFAEAYFLQGSVSLQEKEWEQAIANFSEAMANDPKNALGYANRPEYGQAYLGRGTQALEQKHYEQAIPDLERAAKYLPMDARIPSRLGAAWFGQKNWQKAIESLSTALDLDPNDTDYLSRGRAYREFGQLEKASADFAEAISLNAQNAAAYAARGDACLDRDDVKGALADFDQAIRICTEKPAANLSLANAYSLRASTHLIAGHLDQAAGDFDQAIKLGAAQDLAAIHGMLDTLADAYAEDGKFTAAAQWSQKALELAPDDDTKKEYRVKLEKYQAGKDPPKR